MAQAGTVLSGLVVATALVFSSDAGAQTARYELDADAPLSADGWTFIQSGATSSFGSGSLRLQSTMGVAEWLLRNAAGEPVATKGWLADASPGRGWWVETRVQIVNATNCFGGGPGLRMDDGKSFIQLHFDTSGAHFIASQIHDFAVSGGFHAYRVQNLGGRHFQLLIDGVIAFDDPALQTSENGKILMFGDLGGCDASDSTWDYVAYDAFGPSAAPGDEDEDGVANAQDNCVLLANADQADGDGDGVGNVCDICAQDANNDQDNDGLCADSDTCPSDPRNDQDKNGVCDTQQCLPFQLGTSLPGACPVVCNCLPVGNDPIGGFGNLDNFAGSYPIGTGGAGGARPSGGASHGGGRAGSGSLAGSASAGGEASSVADASASDDAGCACRLHGGFRSNAFAGWLALGALVAALGRRRVHARVTR